MPDVSIVLPTYNGERFLRESIESVISQTFTDWELIIVNDCSTDASLNIAMEYAARDGRIQIISNGVNMKLPASLNIGFGAAKGRYLTWTSDDNVYLPDAIAEMYSFLEKNTSNMMVCAKTKHIDESGHDNGLTTVYDPHTIYAQNTVGACFMYRRQVLNDIGGYDTDMFCVEDYEYWLRILQRYGEIEYIDKPLYLYRDQQYSLTSTRIDRIRNQRFKLLNKYFDFIVERIRKNSDNILPLLITMLSDATEDYDVIKNQLIKYSEEINPIVKVPDNKQIIVYGAGNIGKAALKKYGDRVAFFSDGDTSKVGKIINGIEIISIEDMKKNIPEYAIIAAVGCDKMTGVIRSFAKADIQYYSVFIG